MKREDLDKHHHLEIPKLLEAVTKLELQLVEARQKIKLGQEKNVHAVKNIRKDIAQIKTIIRHRELVGKPASTKKLTSKASLEPSKKPTKTTQPKTTNKQKKDSS